MYIKQISIFLENKSGQLAEAAEFLKKNNIDLRALSIADTAEFGILRIIVDAPEATLSLLKEEGYACTVTDMLAVQIKDAPGGLAEAVSILAENGISVEYSYAFPTLNPETALLIFRVEDNAAAESALKKAGFCVLGQEILNK